MKKCILLLSVLGLCGSAHAEDELKKRDAYRDKVVWRCAAVPTMSYGILKAYAPQVITKIVSVMPAAVTKLGTSTLGYTAPCLIPALGLAFAYLVVSDMLASRNASQPQKQSEGIDQNVQAGAPASPLKNVASWYSSFCAHTGRNLKNLALPVAFSLLGLGYSF